MGVRRCSFKSSASWPGRTTEKQKRLGEELPLECPVPAWTKRSTCEVDRRQTHELKGLEATVALHRVGAQDAFTRAVNGSMDVGMEGWPVEHPKSWSASNTPIFKQAWASMFTTGIWKPYDWIVKVDPDTVLFPDRLRTILRGQSPTEKIAMFDGGEMCKTGMGGLAVLSRGVVEAFAGLAHFFLNIPVQREDGLLSAIANDFLHAKIVREPNLVLNPVLYGCHVAWKAAYHPFKETKYAQVCIQTAPYAPPPAAAELHTRCT